MISFCQFLFTFVALFCTYCQGFSVIQSRPRINARLSMGFGDMLKKAFENDSNLPPPTNPGMSTVGKVVEVEFLPSKKVIKAYLGQNIGQIAKAAGVEIKYKCKKGECKTCEVNFNGSIVKACISSLPATSNLSKFQIGVPNKL